MTLTLICRNCNEEISGEDEDALVTAAQAHHATAHTPHDHPADPTPHTPTRPQILARLRHHQRRHGPGPQAEDGSTGAAG
jgi:hypothetical protein